MGTSVDPRGKIVFDADDPKRPRFTLEELKDILQERNNLKANVSDLEDELEMFRPKPTCSVVSNRLKIQSNEAAAVCDCAFHSGTEHADYFSGEPSLAIEAEFSSDSEESDSEDLPVQGPMPYEPEDAPWKRRETSGIRKFFRQFFGSQKESEQPEACPSPAHSPRSIRKSISRF